MQGMESRADGLWRETVTGHSCWFPLVVISYLLLVLGYQLLVINASFLVLSSWLLVISY